MGNINNKHQIESKDADLFNDMEEWENGIYCGIGIKKMKAYKCNLTLNELNKRRERFWKLKTNPKNFNWTIWIIIHQAVVYDEHRSSLLLEEYEIKPLNGCINHLIDKLGNKYDIPNFCINDPYYERDINQNNIEKCNLKIKFYTYGNESPKFLEVINTMTGKDLKEKYKNKFMVNKDKNIRMFISGVEIKNEQFLYQHNINKEKPIYVIIN